MVCVLKDGYRGSGNAGEFEKGEAGMSELKEFKLGEVSSKILPPYSPNLNPIERVWKVMNEHVRNNKVFDSFTEFKAKIRTFFSATWNTILPDLPSRINDNFQKLKPVVSI